MNNAITDREDLFLAKIAGKSVNINTMTPPVAASVREKLMLDIADRLSGAAAGPAAATTKAAGVVKMAANVAAAAGDNPTKAEFDALLDALVTAGIMAPGSSQSSD